MPMYTFKNTETGEIVDKVMRISELDAFREANPHMVSYFDKAPSVIGGLDNSSGGRLPDGFKDKLKQIKDQHPGAGGVDHLI